MKAVLIILHISIIYCMPLSALITNSNPGPLAIKQTPGLEITGNGSSPEWDRTEWINILQRGNDKINYKTNVKILWSSEGIYFLFYCEDQIINATMTENNANLWEEDVVEVFLMPDENSNLYFEYQISPLNYELTLLIPNLDGDRRFLGWLPWKYEGDRKTIHKTAILKDDDGSTKAWTAEFLIPWKLMDPLVTGPPEPGTRWRANFYRLDYDHGPTRFSWQNTDNHFHEPHNFGTIVFK